MFEVPGVVTLSPDHRYRIEVCLPLEGGGGGGGGGGGEVCLPLGGGGGGGGKSVYLWRGE